MSTVQQSPVYTNRYSGKCNNCKIEVEAQEGYTQKIDGRYVVWCKECVPVRKTAPVQAQRKLTAEGQVIMPYEPENITLVKSLPGARWNPELRRWSVSLEMSDRRRILEVADRIGLEVDPSLRIMELSEEAKSAHDARLYPFQVIGVDFLAQKDRALLADEMGLGKAQPLTCKLATPTGWILMKDVKVGDKVLGSDGKSYNVTGVFPRGKMPVFKVVFSDETYTFCSDDHLWAVNTTTRNWRGNPHRILPLSEIRTRLQFDNGNNIHFIPITKPVEYLESELPLDSYLLGYLLANGNMTTNTPNISIPDDETLRRVLDMLPNGVSCNYTSGIDYRLSATNEKFETNPLTKILRDLGIMGKYAWEKSIPDVYKYSLLEERRRLLKGMMDGDGSVTKADNHLEYTTTSEQLANDVQEIVQSLGGIARINLKEFPEFEYLGEKKIGRPAYRVSISLPDSESPFLLSRKKDVYQVREKYKPCRAIVNVQEVSEQEVQCISVDSPDKLYLTDNFIVTHNTVQSLMGIPREVGKTLVICRAGLKYNWYDEVKKWRPDLSVTVLSGRKSFRWPNPGEVVIINNDILPEEFNTPKKKSTESMEQYWARLEVYRNNLKTTYPQASEVYLIVDEAHDYKNRDAARTRKVKELGKLCGRLAGLTGSPLTNRPEDLYGVLDVLGMAREVFGSWDKYQKLYNVVYDTIRAHGRYIRVPIWGKPQPIVPELLRRVMLRRLRNEVLQDLPEKIYTNLTVNNIDSDLKNDLDEMWDEWGTVIEGGELPPFEEFSAIRQKLAESRIPDVLEYAENAEEQEVPLVVFCAHLAPLKALAERPGWKIITGDTPSERRQEIVRDFQAGKLKGVGLTIQAGGVGITLTHAWKSLFVDLAWTPAANWQAEDRLARIGQTANKVEITRMVSNHPLDLHVHRLLTDKIDTIIRSIDLTIKGEKKEAINVQEETVEEYEGRMKTLTERAAALEKERQEKEQADQKARAKTKVEGIHQREKSRMKREILPLTPKRVEAVRKAFRHMLSVCDGAKMKDSCGFNKPDAVVAHWLLSAGLETDQEVEAGFCILSRYHRQLQGDYPILFKKEKGE